MSRKNKRKSVDFDSLDSQNSIESDENESTPEDDIELSTIPSLDQDDILISIALRHFDVIKNKSTNKSLTPLHMQTTMKNAWNEIVNEFKSKTGVRLICVLCFRAKRLYFHLFFFSSD